MTVLDERYSDLLDAGHDPDLVRLVAQLDTMRQGIPSRRGDIRIRQALGAHAGELTRTTMTQPVAPVALPSSQRLPRVRATHRVAWSRRLHARLTVPIAALVVLMLSVGTYLHGQSPTPASAQTILRQAATAGLAPNQITHFVYQVTNTNGYGSTVQFWVEADTNGAPNRLAFDPSPDYNAALRYLVGAYEENVGHNSPASLAGSQVMGQQTIEGALVDVVRAPSGAMLYFDAQSYVLRTADWTDQQQGGAQNAVNSTWHAQLLQYATVPASDAPALPWHIDLHGFSSTVSDATPQSKSP
jgi:hypothetical protein